MLKRFTTVTATRNDRPSRVITLTTARPCRTPGHELRQRLPLPTTWTHGHAHRCSLLPSTTMVSPRPMAGRYPFLHGLGREPISYSMLAQLRPTGVTTYWSG